MTHNIQITHELDSLMAVCVYILMAVCVCVYIICILMICMY